MSAQTQRIINALDAIQPELFGGNEVERLQVRAAARRLLARVESPYERAWGFCFEHPAVFAALQTCIDVSLWKAWTEIGGGEKTIDQLVKMSTPTIDTNLLRKALSSYAMILTSLQNICRSPVPLVGSFQCR